MNKKIIAATNNKGKLAELKKILETYGFEPLSLSEAGITADPDETGTSFEENAALKARQVYELAKNAEKFASVVLTEGKYKAQTVADDSGLAVDALGGEPGVYSARYAQPGKRRQKILDNLDNLPYEKRTAKFVCCICYIDESGDEKLFRGELSGHIGFENKGENGFGYDSIFEVKPGVTLAMLTDEEKNKISHRGKALEKLAEYLRNL